jgi:hypothetical protein
MSKPHNSAVIAAQKADAAYIDAFNNLLSIRKEIERLTTNAVKAESDLNSAIMHSRATMKAADAVIRLHEQAVIELAKRANAIDKTHRELEKAEVLDDNRKN